ncbi:hypothetical protein [Streptomyces sp. NPDC058657]|uniref:hypothetical protein n=1 Tax=unclassified Streptomyces TaxID=2593676 RepID=UPI00365FED06
MALAGLVAVGGCCAMLSERPERIARGRIAGIWIGENGARVVMRVDGRFEMSGIPRSALTPRFSEPPLRGENVSGSGTWTPVGDSGSVTTISLSIAAGGSFAEGTDAEELGVARSGEGPVLYFSTDPDKWYGFELRKTGS